MQIIIDCRLYRLSMMGMMCSLVAVAPGYQKANLHLILIPLTVNVTRCGSLSLGNIAKLRQH
jgi:hypothetical protein